jgi:DNA-binding transcriptional LysR family regulator
MRRTPYGEFTAFMAVAEQRNFTQAAKQIGISTATLSQTIRSLEERLGVRLLNRTTRSVAPTEAGEMLLSRLKPVLEDYEAAIDSINQFRDKPAGLLRLTVAPPVIHSVLAPRIGEFTALYPEIRLEISVEATNVDIVANQFDAGIRLEGRIDRDMIAVRVSDRMRMAMVASPDYLQRHGRPGTPQELQNHNCIRLRLSNGAILPWRLRGNGKPLEAHISGSLIANDIDLIRVAALEGVGIIYGPSEYVARDLAEGRLVPILEDWTPLAGSWFLYYPSRRQTPAALQALIDFFRVDKKPQIQADKKASRGA